MSQDYYQTLGVSKGASKEEIRKAFKKIAKESHPDVKPDDKVAAERFKAAAEAYDVLGDEDKRKKYDQYGANWSKVPEGGPFGGGRSGGSPFRNGGPVDIDLQDIFGGRGGVDLESMFGGMFGGGGPVPGGGAGRARPPQAQRGEDVATVIRVPFMVAAKGGSHDLYANSQRLTAQVPAGIEDGKTIRLSGQGQPGINGGPNGDVLVTVRVEPHPYFRREGNQLLLDVPVSVMEAILGAKIDVPTLSDGMVTLTLPPGTSSGAKLRLKGKGLPDLKTKVIGDQFVVIKIVSPKDLDDRAKQLLEELSEHLKESPRENLWT